MIDFVAFTPQGAATAIGNFQVHGPSDRLDPGPLPVIHQRLGSVLDRQRAQQELESETAD